LIFKADGNLNSDRIRAQARDNGFERTVKRGAGAIEFVYEADSRHAVLIGLTPHCFRLRLNTSHAVKYRHGPVEHAQRTLDFHGEVDVSGRVDDV
jgi:hypothetical protein